MPQSVERERMPDTDSMSHGRLCTPQPTAHPGSMHALTLSCAQQHKRARTSRRFLRYSVSCCKSRDFLLSASASACAPTREYLSLFVVFKHPEVRGMEHSWRKEASGARGNGERRVRRGKERGKGRRRDRKSCSARERSEASSPCRTRI